MFPVSKGMGRYVLRQTNVELTTVEIQYYLCFPWAALPVGRRLARPLVVGKSRLSYSMK